VARVQTSLQVFPPFSRKDVSVQLSQRGLATLYTGGGAEYDGNRELLEAKQKEAKKKKRGVWSQGDKMMSSAEFKRQQKLLKQVAQN
jgi:endonuclease YncB( thermonuclease family)